MATEDELRAEIARLRAALADAKRFALAVIEDDESGQRWLALRVKKLADLARAFVARNRRELETV